MFFAGPNKHTLQQCSTSSAKDRKGENTAKMIFPSTPLYSLSLSLSQNILLVSSPETCRSVGEVAGNNLLLAPIMLPPRYRMECVGGGRIDRTRAPASALLLFLPPSLSLSLSLSLNSQYHIHLPRVNLIDFGMHAPGCKVHNGVAKVYRL